MIFETGKRFSVSPVLLYQLTEYKQYGGQQHWFSAGARPQAHFNDYLSLAFEPFVDWVDDKSTNISGYLFKMTFAPQVSLDNHFMSRPAIRALVTCAQWATVSRDKSEAPTTRTAPRVGHGACRWEAGGRATGRARGYWLSSWS
jgi:maltoporin